MKERIDRVLSHMAARGLSQMIVSDPKSIWYLTGVDVKPEHYAFELSLPYGTDGIIVNLPGILAGLPQEAWMSEFIPAPEPVSDEADDLPSEDDFDLEPGGDV